VVEATEQIIMRCGALRFGSAFLFCKMHKSTIYLSHVATFCDLSLGLCLDFESLISNILPKLILQLAADKSIVC
jgi:hypothetical protein